MVIENILARGIISLLSIDLQILDPPSEYTSARVDAWRYSYTLLIYFNWRPNYCCRLMIRDINKLSFSCCKSICM